MHSTVIVAASASTIRRPLPQERQRPSFKSTSMRSLLSSVKAANAVIEPGIELPRLHAFGQCGAVAALAVLLREAVSRLAPRALHKLRLRVHSKLLGYACSWTTLHSACTVSRARRHP